MTKALFICGKDRRRSSTAAEFFGEMDGMEVSSAGTSVEAECPVSADPAGVGGPMEKKQRHSLRDHFGGPLKDKKVVCFTFLMFIGICSRS